MTKNMTVRDQFILRVFQHEVSRQCQYVLRSFVQLVESHTDDELPSWYPLQNLCVAAGNIQKLLWGSGTSDKKIRAYRKNQRQLLRASLGVANNSILRLSPEFRNHLEHMDERIEAWSMDSTQLTMAQDFIGTPDEIEDVEPTNVFRAYDPATYTFFFQGDRFELLPVVQAASLLLEKASDESAKPYGAASDTPSESDSSADSG